MKHLIHVFFFVGSVCLAAAGAFAEDVKPDQAIPESVEGLGDAAKPGWHPALRVSGNFALGHNDNVPGQADGVSVNFGYLIDGGLGYLSETLEHEWANTLTAQLGYARTPIVDAWMKSLDLIQFKSEYLYHIPDLRWIGPFLAFRLDTPMLPGFDVRPEDVNVLKIDVGETFETNASGQPLDENGEVINANSDRVEKVSAGRQIRLTGAFAPLTMRESAGLFLLPVESPPITIDIRAGFGVWETFVRGGYALADNPDTDNLLELQKLQDSVQMGPEAGIALSGLYEDMVVWRVAAHFMQPVYHTADTDLEGVDLMNMEFDASLGLRFAPWASLDYVFKAYRQPLIVDDWQIQNGLFVSLTADIIADDTAAPPPPACPEPPPAPAPLAEASASTTPAGQPASEPAAEPAPAPEPASEPAPAPESAD